MRTSELGAYGDAIRATVSDHRYGQSPCLVYLAIVRGVYRHQVLCASATPGECEDAGVAFIGQEHDHYHDVEIVSIPLNAPGEERVESRVYACFGGEKEPCCGLTRRGEFTGTVTEPSEDYLKDGPRCPA